MDVPNYYEINKILLTCIGQWPFQTRLSSRIILTIVLLFTFTQVGPAVAAGVKYRHQTDIILECVTPYLLVILYYTKLITYLINSEKIVKLMNFIIEDWKIWSQDQEIAVLHEYGKFGKKMILVYTVIFEARIHASQYLYIICLTIFLCQLCDVNPSIGIDMIAGVYFATWTYVLQPLILKIIDKLVYNVTSPGEFPYPVYYFQLDVQKYYYLLVGFACIACTVALSIVVATDTMFIASMQHSCAIFSALGQKLWRIGEKQNKLDETDVDFERLAICIVRHNRAIKFAELIESIYTMNFLVIMGINLVLMSFTGLQVFTRISSPQEIFKYVVFIEIQMVHLFIECYISQRLFDHSAMIREHIHYGKWYNASLRSQKLLQLMILRCSKPCKLTAGKICDMSLETFLSVRVVKTSMSYFTLLRSIQ